MESQFFELFGNGTKLQLISQQKEEGEEVNEKTKNDIIEEGI